MNVQTDSVVLPRWRDELTAYWKDDGPRFMHIAKVALAVTLAMGCACDWSFARRARRWFRASSS